MVDDPKGFGLDEFFNDGKRYPLCGGYDHLSMLIHPQVDILHVFADEFVFNWNAFIFYGVQFHCKISLSKDSFPQKVGFIPFFYDTISRKG